jgi:hypothetical protein
MVRGHVASTAIALCSWIKKIAIEKAKVIPHLEARGPVYLKTALRLSHGLVIPGTRKHFNKKKKKVFSSH